MIRILSVSDTTSEAIFARKESAVDVSKIVMEIIETVRNEGDRALFAYSKRFDRNDLTALEVSNEEWEAGVKDVEPLLLETMKRAAENIRAFHENQKRSGFSMNGAPGIVLGQRVLPIEKVGLYVPGGLAAYPSSVLMNVIPAKIAGCSEIVITTPASAEGTINPAILAAAKLAGADRIFKIGGAQAIAALAYGTESVPKVDKIVGPGNAFVAEAKRQVFGTVSIDMIAGPSEILVVADKASNPKFVAADLLSQAEHDRMASAVLVTDSAELAKAVQEELERQLPLLEREEIARESIETNGKIIVTESMEEAISIANEIAPEHLEICVDSPFDWLGRVKHAGSVFLGRYCPEALGDYLSGTNHVLPTSGTARFSSPLSVDDFVKKMQYTYYTKEAFRALADDVGRFAEAEGLTAHAKSAYSRKED